MALNFPENPLIKDRHLDNEGVTWEWDGSQWDSITVDGVTELNDLIDYNDSTPTIDNYIGYNNSSKIWESKPLVMQEVFVRLGLTVDVDLKASGYVFKFDKIEEDYNNSGAYDTSTGFFTVPYSGWYSVDCGFTTRLNPSLYWDVYLNLNGNDYARIARCRRYQFEYGGNPSSIRSMNIIAYFSYHDVLEFNEVGGSANANEAWLDSTMCYGQITLLQ